MSKKGVEVFVRKRPLLENDEDVIQCEGGNKLTVLDHKVRVDMSSFEEKHVFYFDKVINDKTDSIPIIDYISHAMAGNSSLIFCYGQTGSGKSYTMLSKNGLVYTGLADILTFCSISLCIFEIYQNNVHDLLNNRSKCDLREYQGKIVVKNLTEAPIEIKQFNKATAIIEKALESRSTSSTNQNQDSSRSHAIIQIKLNAAVDPSSSQRHDNVNNKGILSFIDLAGSEKAGDRGDTSNKIRSEGADINKSLLALKECIRAMDQKKNHTPFRQSKLTMVLKDGFVGNARTLMIACIAPNRLNTEHTLNTLRYADRVKELDEDKINGKMNATYSNYTPNAPDVTMMDMDDVDDDKDDSLIDVHSELTSPEKSSQPNLRRKLQSPQLHQRHSMGHIATTTAIPRKPIFKPTNKLPSTFNSAIPVPKLSDAPQQPPLPHVITPPNAHHPTGSPSLLSPTMPQAEIRDKMDKFIIEHRKYIRNFSDMYKKDMDVLAQLTLSLSSQKETRAAFDDYLRNVDELAQRKIQYANTLRQYIHSLK